MLVSSPRKPAEDQRALLILRREKQCSSFLDDQSSIKKTVAV